MSAQTTDARKLEDEDALPDESAPKKKKASLRLVLISSLGCVHTQTA
jgi:hypothetical protein